MATPRNPAVRMVVGYWDMAASMVVHQAIDHAMFIDAHGEIFSAFSKVRGLLPQIREVYGAGFMRNVETVVMGVPDAEQLMGSRYARLYARFRAMAAARSSAASRCSRLPGLRFRSKLTPRIGAGGLMTRLVHPVPAGSGRTADALAAEPAVATAALDAFFALAGRWQLDTDEQRVLLGSPAASTLFAWKKGRSARLAPDVLVRISYLLGIAAALSRLFALAPARADAWMRTPNSGPLTRGRTPLDVALEGGVLALHSLRMLLEQDAGGQAEWGMPVMAAGASGTERAPRPARAPRRRSSA